jgi:hypothetical protein
MAEPAANYQATDLHMMCQHSVSRWLKCSDWSANNRKRPKKSVKKQRLSPLWLDEVCRE